MTPYAPGITPEGAAATDALKAEALRRALTAGLIGVGVGAGTGLAFPAFDALLGKKRKAPSEGAVEVDVPVPRKQADWADEAVSTAMPTPVGAQAPVPLSPQWLRDGGADNRGVAGIPWAVPAAVGTGIAGLVGAHQLTRWLLHKAYKGNLSHQLRNAQREYDDAMASSYSPPSRLPLGKAAAATTALDALYDAYEKRAEGESWWSQLPNLNETLGGGLGLYLTGAGALAGGTGYALYQHLNSQSKQKAIQDALRRRAIIRGLQSPMEVYVSPRPEDER